MADPQGSGSAQKAQQEAGDQSKPGGEDGRGAGHADASDDAEVAFPQQRKDFSSFAPVRLFFSNLAEAAGKENPSQVSQQLQIRHFRYWTERDGGHKAEITLDSGDRGDWIDIVDSVKEGEGVNRDRSIFWPSADSSSLSMDKRASTGRVFIYRGTTPLFRLFVQVQKALDAEAGGEASFAQQALISKYAQICQDWNAATKRLKGERVEFLQEWQTGLPDRGERDGNDEREGRGRDPILKGSWKSPGFAEDSLSPEPVRADRSGTPKRGARGFGRNPGTVEKDQRAHSKFGGEYILMRGGFGEVSRGAPRSGLFGADGWEGGPAAKEDEMKSIHSRAEGCAMGQVAFFPRSLAQQRSQASPPTDVSMGTGPSGTDASVVQSFMHINRLKGRESGEGDGGVRPPRY
uniref:Uncharacterized protein n=1 Tax=Chromera velia CCMP2878 TaxID=1169474 RepID=A0A0G4I6J3_9ALVE|eukprot:Cvel_11338.t1-p1 / transcript=Cvel_11338.t1 / gene=Cvel_11338 / organism=Chromera_velia_CCMP2878 / gene_product=hypothetical protein / transcript_product=hypothetical protein / location=Cvel_scaffold710:14228-15783(+) / protein_length=404 / sequence_SO=supercontig / SO=protein_coding / is_pseudo=false